MKLRYLFGAFLATVFAVSCEMVDPLVGDHAEINVDKSIVAIPMTGGSASVTADILDSWKIQSVPEWLTVNPNEGEAGENIKIDFTAGGTAEDRVAELKLVCADKVQIITVNQPGDPALKPVWPAFTGGDFWIMFDKEGTWVTAQPVSGNYGYLNVEDAVVTEGALSSSAGNKFTFTAVEGGFTIQDVNGKYYYQKDDYNSYNLTDAPTEGHIWSVEQIGEKEFTVTNNAKGKWMQLDKSYGTVGSYDSVKGFNPYLVPFSETVPGPGPETPSLPDGVTGDGSLAKPFSVADVLLIQAAGAITSDNVHVKGIVVGTPSISLQYGNADYYIGDAADAETTLKVYRGKYLENEKFTAEDQLMEGAELVLLGVIGEYEGALEFKNSQIVSLAKPAIPISIAYELGTNAYDDGVAVVNDVRYKTVKIGSSKNPGDFTITLPAGTKKLVYSAVCWKGLSDVKITFTPEGGEAKEMAVAANVGATGNAPYTITATEADTYTLDFAVEAETKVKVSSDKRIVFWAIDAE